MQAFSVLFASSFAITRHAIVGMGSHAGFHDGPASVVGHVQEAYLAAMASFFGRWAVDMAMVERGSIDTASI